MVELEELLSDFRNMFRRLRGIENSCETTHAQHERKWGNTDPRPHTFSNIHNLSCICTETLGHYFRWCSRPEFKEEWTVEEFDWGAAPRVYSVTKGFFISVVSLIEFNLRRTISLYPSSALFPYINRKQKLLDTFNECWLKLDPSAQMHLQEFRQLATKVPPYDSFGLIIEAAKSKELLTRNDYKLWKFVLETRNIVVHNNQRAVKDYGIKLSGVEYLFKKDELPTIELDFFVVLVEELLKPIERLLDAAQAQLTNE